MTNPIQKPTQRCLIKNEKYFYHPGNPKGFKSSVSGTRLQDQILAGTKSRPHININIKAHRGVLKLDPVSLAQGMQCSRWPGLGHTSTTSRAGGEDRTHPKNMVRELGESMVLQRETESCSQKKRMAGLQKQPMAREDWDPCSFVDHHVPGGRYVHSVDPELVWEWNTMTCYR